MSDALENPTAGSGEPAVDTAGQPGVQPDTGDKTILDGGGGTPLAPQDWPEDWRTRMLGSKDAYNDDEYDKELKRLNERFQSPQDIWKFAREAERFANSRKPEPQRPGKDAKAEDIDAYRLAKGIPPSPKDYNLDFDDGFVIGEDMKEGLDDVLEFAHQNHFDPDTTKSIARKWAESQQESQEALRAANEQVRVETRNALMQEWGGEFQGNLNAINTAFANAPKELMARVLTAKDAEGFNIGNDPDVVRWLSALGRELSPAATLVPPTQNNAQGITEEIQKIEKLMWSNDPAERKQYRGNPEMQKRYRDLLTAREKMKGNS